MRSSIIPILGLPLALLFSILPSSTSFNNPSPLTTCPIQFFFRLTIVSTILLLSTTSSTSSLLILSSQLTFSNLLQTHISNASNLSIASFFMTQVSHPYSATGHTRTLINLFLSTLFILLESDSFRLLNASFAHIIRCFISSIHLPSSAITDPRYLNVLTCSTLCPSIMILTVSQSFFEKDYGTVLISIIQFLISKNQFFISKNELLISEIEFLILKIQFLISKIHLLILKIQLIRDWTKISKPFSSNHERRELEI